MRVALDFSIHVVDLEELWTFVLGTKQSVRTTSLQFHTFASRIYLVRFHVCRKPALAQPETLKAQFKRRTLHVPNLMQMRKIYCFRSFALDSAHVKFDV